MKHSKTLHRAIYGPFGGLLIGTIRKWVYCVGIYPVVQLEIRVIKLRRVGRVRIAPMLGYVKRLERFEDFKHTFTIPPLHRRLPTVHHPSI